MKYVELMGSKENEDIRDCWFLINKIFPPEVRNVFEFAEMGKINKCLCKNWKVWKRMEKLAFSCAIYNFPPRLKKSLPSGGNS